MRVLKMTIVGMILLLGLVFAQSASAQVTCFIAQVDRVGDARAFGINGEAGHFTHVPTVGTTPVFTNQLFRFNPDGAKSMLAAALTAVSLDENVTMCTNNADTSRIDVLWLRLR